jgi:hypothetical protein
MTRIVSINIDRFGDIDGLRFFKIVKKPKTQKINKRRKRRNNANDNAQTTL